jgi:acyl-CoA synthetase (AMP-forming)/AMP-acid ligase II
MDTVYLTFSDSAGRYPEKAFLHIPLAAAGHYSDCAIDLTYGQALSQVEALKALYRQAGYGSGHRVALLLQNRADFLLHWFALNAWEPGWYRSMMKWQPTSRPTSSTTVKPPYWYISRSWPGKLRG